MNADQENLENNVKARFWYHAYKVARYQREQLQQDRDNLLAEVKKLRRILAENSQLPSFPPRGASPSHSGDAPFLLDGKEAGGA